MNVLILAAGVKETQPMEDGYPLLLAEIDGMPLIEHVINSVARLEPKKITITMRRTEMNQFHLDNIVNILCASADVVAVNDGVKGAVCTALLASPSFDNDEELLIINVNQLVDIDLAAVLETFRARKLDAGLITFDSIHPRYSYVRIDTAGRVIEASEKRPISKMASAGIYWFAKGARFVAAAKNMIRKDVQVGGDFYVTPVLNELILDQAVIGAHQIEKTQYQPVKNENQLKHAVAHI
ncbi:glycosyltransferase family 2 protein [Paraburkholderia bonniea]|uniref:glycosyltransferase family 2 protein n=1 Tax=Paraburkholderia bonniea TaxID=2152891 RepID=UPI001290C2E8|nr:glycosyltransferase family 2 protein [Paraburkholderia bonniea]WJF90818.1 glycosyltransferase family 2 protein [Paraburkholderia bonniea]WJF94132.1 glycosyltransferase family 2 protein [Paraburkholderia bonniea]